ncbi:MAG: hypothetical protein EOP06_26590 [Proteobacteria bacterium]|nr:MAG: hypothetical protein EOP06_26590 [Pseudomonadota bacterium]
MREAAALQREGKKATSLSTSTTEKPVVDEKTDAELGDDDKDKELGAQTESLGMDAEDMKKCMAEITAMQEKLAELVKKLGAVGEETDKLAASEKSDEEKEKELAADDDKDALGADDEDETTTDEKEEK